MKSKIDSPVLGAVILCAGKGTRTGLPYNKILHAVGQKTVLERVLDTFSQCGFSRIAVVCSSDDKDRISEITTEYENIIIVLGGTTRAESVLNGLKACPCDIVAIHDGARPFTTKDIILKALKSANDFGSGVVAVPTTDTIKYIADDGTVKSIPRDRLVNMQTPQAFLYGDILNAYSVAPKNVTDDAEAYELWGGKTKIVDGDYSNIKITTATDLYSCVPSACRIGIGYDVHRLAEGRLLILGGVRIDHVKGLLGHSDADVLTHAIMDALLSAADCPDIGVLFPDTDKKYANAVSTELLKTVLELVKKRGYTIQSISAVIIAQTPKLMNIIPNIRENLANIIGIDPSVINISATTTEKLGTIGNGEAIASSATCILTENSRG